MKHITLVIIILILLTGAALAQDTTVLDVVIQHPELSIFRTTMQETDLLSIIATSDNMTIFAPSDAAIEAYARQQDIEIETLLRSGDLQPFLAYHLVPARLPSRQIRDLIGFSSSAQATTLSQQPLTFTTRDNHIFVDGAMIVQQDILARNGVVHIIDRLLIPASNSITGTLKLWSESDYVEITITEGTINLTDLVTTDTLRGELELLLPDGSVLRMTLIGEQTENTLEAIFRNNEETLSIFRDALQQNDVLSDEDTYTIFAPTNAAFEQWADDNLADLLHYHIIPGQLTTDMLVSNLRPDETLQLQMLDHNLTTLEIVDDRLHINGAQIIMPNLMTSNGVIHIIDQVLVPSPQSP